MSAVLGATAEMLNVKSSSSNTTPVVKVTTAYGDVKKGFEISSPVVSGRNIPVDCTDDKKLPETPNNSNIFKVSKEQSNRDAKQLYMTERTNEKHHFHMIVIGHVDAGKSTVMGHLLFDTGNVSQRIMHKHEQES